MENLKNYIIDRKNTIYNTLKKHPNCYDFYIHKLDEIEHLEYTFFKKSVSGGFKGNIQKYYTDEGKSQYIEGFKFGIYTD